MGRRTIGCARPAAIEHGYRVLFTTAAQLIANLTNAHAEGRLDEKRKLYTTPRLLIIAEKSGSCRGANSSSS
jgi:DNA replication protein DnaC